MSAIQTVVIIGSGNVAFLMGNAFKQAGLDVWGIYSKTYANAEILAQKLDTKSYASIDEIPKDADAYLLAVTDLALANLIPQLLHFEGVLMHTSGSVGIDVYPEHLKNTAVFYPLQTFSKAKELDYLQIPILIESNDSLVLYEMQNLGNKISNIVRRINSEQRKQLHLAAVFSSNFSNYMYQIADELLMEYAIDFNLLKPLLKETVAKLDKISPAKAQTGPAVRYEEKTIQEHLKMLENHPEYQNIYRLISDQIKKLKSV
jgi:predicted short-subunit dehydrogenase-like oxidoreductase (DUF2520 family)